MVNRAGSGALWKLESARLGWAEQGAPASAASPVERYVNSGSRQALMDSCRYRCKLALQKHSRHQGQSKAPADNDALGTSRRDCGKRVSHRKNLRSTAKPSRVVTLFVGRQFSLAGQQRPLLGEFVGLRIARFISDTLVR